MTFKEMMPSFPELKEAESPSEQTHCTLGKSMAQKPQKVPGRHQREMWALSSLHQAALDLSLHLSSEGLISASLSCSHSP